MVQNMKTEDRKKLDDALVRVGNPTVSWSPPLEIPEKRKVPSWWRGDAAAAQSSISAARSMGFTVMEQT